MTAGSYSEETFRTTVFTIKYATRINHCNKVTTNSRQNQNHNCSYNYYYAYLIYSITHASFAFEDGE